MIICKFPSPEEINDFVSRITPDKYVAIWCRDFIADGRTDFAKFIVTDEFKNPLPGTYTCLFSGNAVDAPNVSVDTMNAI